MPRISRDTAEKTSAAPLTQQTRTEMINPENTMIPGADATNEARHDWIINAAAELHRAADFGHIADAELWARLITAVCVDIRFTAAEQPTLTNS
jgi:hypothetical protein